MVDNTKKLYYVVIGDLVASRKMPDRNRVQDKLKEAMDHVNEHFRSEIIAPFIITRGDEIAAVFKTIYSINKIINNFIDILFPIQIRFGIGRGELTTSINTGLATEIDGPGFYVGAEALEEARRTRRWIIFRLNNPLFDKSLTSLKNLLIVLKQSWSPHQRKICRLYEEIGSQKKVAESLQVSQQAVAKSLRNALWSEYVEGEMTVEWLLKKI